MLDVIRHNLPFLISGLDVTIVISLAASLAGTILGLVVAIIRYLRIPVLSQAAALYVGFVRGTPLLVMLFICYFALPALLAYRTTAFRATILGFSLFIGAYLAEDFRAGLQSIRPSLIQAALGTGLTRVQALRLIIVPLAVRNVVPPVFSQYVRIFKFTSVASVIGVPELTGSALLINAREFQPVTLLVATALTYLVFCTGISLVGRLLYARLAVSS